MNAIHRSPYGTYHPAPDSEVAWTVFDVRGSADEMSECDNCGQEESFLWHCLDGGEAYCDACFDALPDKPEIIDCNC